MINKNKIKATRRSQRQLTSNRNERMRFEMVNITYTEVFAMLEYEPTTGNLFWRERTADMFGCGKRSAQHSCNIWNSRFAGKKAFTARDSYGYHHGSINGTLYTAHRIIWLLHSGSWPDADIDHINGMRCDNRICNLRAVSRAENGKNHRIHRNNTSGVLGVSWNNARGKWHVSIRVNGVQRFLGLYETLDDAVAVRKVADIEHGYHANHGA